MKMLITQWKTSDADYPVENQFMFSHSSSWIDQHDGNWIETESWKAPKRRWFFFIEIFIPF